uniref:Uncharacterized protein n=1 Tax=Pongo abelii TaxID=9601 RepID=A0A8I5UAK4_PONAB
EAEVAKLHMRFRKARSSLDYYYQFRLEFSGSSNSPASASQVAGITGDPPTSASQSLSRTPDL